LAAVPSIGRASRVERPTAPGADAATELYERYSGQVFGYCLHRLGSREEAEDAVQTTFMNAFRGLARGIVPELEQAWLFKIAHNVCLSRRRSSWRRGRVEAPNDLEVLQEVVPAKEKVADELIRLQDVLEQMPESQRRAILLREWQGLSYREIGGELGLSQAAVETLIFRARRALAQGLEEASVRGSWRRRIRHGADAGAALAFLKALFGGGGAAAVKLAATIAAVTTAAVATTTADHHPKHESAPAARAPVTPVPRRADDPLVAAASPGPAVRERRRPDRRHAGSRAPAPVEPRRVAPKTGQVAAAPNVHPEPPAIPEPTPAPAHAAPPAGELKRPPAPKDTRTTTNPASAPTPVEAPAEPAPAAGKDNRGKGHDKHDGEPAPAEPAPAEPAPDPAAEAPGNSGDHGNDSAPGQQDKPDKGDKGDNGNNGNGQGGGKSK
jgi:RNA polymerase sigma factor (sigma-70 family)